MNTESILKWLSVAGLSSVLVLLAQQLAPNLVEYAEAEAYRTMSQLPDEEPDEEEQGEAAATGEEGGTEEYRRGGRRGLNARETDDANVRYGEGNRTAREREGVRDDALYPYEQRQGDEDVEPVEPLVEENGERFDVQRGDLPERHEALINGDPNVEPEKRRFDYEREDLRTRHEGLENPEPFRLQDSNDDEPHVQWFGDRYEEREDEQPKVKYYLVPVPEGEGDQE